MWYAHVIGYGFSVFAEAILVKSLVETLWDCIAPKSSDNPQIRQPPWQGDALARIEGVLYIAFFQLAEAELQKGDVQNTFDSRECVALPGRLPDLRIVRALWSNAIPQRLDQALYQNRLSKNGETVPDDVRVPHFCEPVYHHGCCL